MAKVSIVLLRLPDSKVVFQRRDKNARIGPGKLGFFGGHVEKGETHDQAIKRELIEETSLNVDKLNLKHIATFQLESDVGEGTVYFQLYEAAIEGADFEVYEGVRSEVFSIKEVLGRDDLTTSVQYVLSQL